MVDCCVFLGLFFHSTFNNHPVAHSLAWLSLGHCPPAFHVWHYHFNSPYEKFDCWICQLWLGSSHFLFNNHHPVSGCLGLGMSYLDSSPAWTSYLFPFSSLFIPDRKYQTCVETCRNRFLIFAVRSSSYNHELSESKVCVVLV